MSGGGVIQLRCAVVPPDAPATDPGETPWYSGDQYPVQIGVYKRLSLVQSLPWCGLVNPAPGGYGPLPCSIEVAP